MIGVSMSWRGRMLGTLGIFLLMRTIWSSLMMIDLYKPEHYVWIFLVLTVIIHPVGPIRSTNFWTTTKLHRINVFGWRPFTWRARCWFGSKTLMRQASFLPGKISSRHCLHVSFPFMTTQWIHSCNCVRRRRLRSIPPCLRPCPTAFAVFLTVTV